MTQEHFSFQTEAKQLLDLMVHSVYSNRDIFLRELLSNASDALDKRRLELLARPELGEALQDPEIRIVPSREHRTLTISDNGVGMNREELREYIGTIAKSGTREYLMAARDRGQFGSEELIGQFGVGFYSSFMVAFRVDVLSRRLGEEGAWLFSSTGDGTYSLEEAVKDAPGTSVTLHLAPADPARGDRDYADERTIRELVRKYSDFLSYPIVMAVRTGQDSDLSDERLNSGKALWRRPEREVPEEEYGQFYRHIAHDWNDPLLRIVFSVEGGTEFRGVLFVPEKAPYDLHFLPEQRGVQLYIKNVYIMNDCKELVPSWLRFLKGVVDSEDLPLNISREILQEDPLIPVIRKSLTRRVLNALKKTMSSDEEKYRAFWSEFGPVLKEALVPQPRTEEDHREAVLDLCLFPSASSDRGPVSLKEYVASMKEGQEHIYYLTGRRIEALRSSPLLERCLDLGYDALLLADPVDEVAASFLTEYEGKPFRSLEMEDSLPVAQEDRTEKPSGLTAFLKEALGSLVKDVRLSARLTSSPACLVGDREGGSFAMERILRSMGQTPPPVQRILEINVEHPVLQGLEYRLASAGQAGREELKEYAFLLYDQCVLAEGGQLDDPGAFARRVSRLMDRDLGGANDRGPL